MLLHQGWQSGSDIQGCQATLARVYVYSFLSDKGSTGSCASMQALVPDDKP